MLSRLRTTIYAYKIHCRLCCNKKPYSTIPASRLNLEDIVYDSKQASTLVQRCYIPSPYRATTVKLNPLSYSGKFVL